MSEYIVYESPLDKSDYSVLIITLSAMQKLQIIHDLNIITTKGIIIV